MRKQLFLVGLTIMLATTMSFAQDYILTLKNNQFTPNVLNVPADTKIKLVIKNLDPTPAEFESYELNREKVVAGNSEIVVFIGPLKPGNYPYFDDFHRDTTKGMIVAK